MNKLTTKPKGRTLARAVAPTLAGVALAAATAGCPSEEPAVGEPPVAKDPSKTPEQPKPEVVGKVALPDAEKAEPGAKGTPTDNAVAPKGTGDKVGKVALPDADKDEPGSGK